MERKRFELYCLRRPDKGDPLEPGNWQPFYAGRGCNGREFCHRKEAENLLINPNGTNSNSIRNYIIHKLWKQGLDYVEDTIFIELTNDEANEYEREFIAAYGRINNGTGCLANLNDGGDGNCGWIPSEETRKLWSEQRSGENSWNWGVPRPEETCRKISEATTGKFVSDEKKYK